MYRLPNWIDEVMQRVISNEIARGFLRCLGIEKACHHIIIGEHEVQRLVDIYEFHAENAGKSVNIQEKEIISVVAKKLEKMYEELLDERYEYTFDEYGEYLLAMFIEYEREYEGPAATCINIKDEVYLRELFTAEYREWEKEGFFEEFEEESIDEFVGERLLAVASFAYMGLDEFEFESFVFWDSDYTLLDESGGGMLLLTHPEMGFVSGSEEREPISGSVKLEIK